MCRPPFSPRCNKCNEMLDSGMIPNLCVCLIGLFVGLPPTGFGLNFDWGQPEEEDVILEILDPSDSALEEISFHPPTPVRLTAAEQWAAEEAARITAHTTPEEISLSPFGNFLFILNIPLF